MNAQDKLKGLLCYYSSTGNTRLACQYIADKITAVEFDLLDVTKIKAAELANYGVVGFATFTDFWGPPYLFQRFIQDLPQQQGKPAFVFNTFGNLSGRTLKTLEGYVAARGFQVMTGFSLHTPESYPPMIASGRGNEHAPTEQDLLAFDGFIADLNALLARLPAEETVRVNGVHISWLNSLMISIPRSMARRDMGDKFVDEALCKECGACARQCPYQAITQVPKPIFDQTKYFGCWHCFNCCPKQAIYTRKYRGIGRYPRPLDRLKKMLGEPVRRGE